MSERTDRVRKAVFVPAYLWRSLRVEAAQRDVEISDVVTEMLRQRYDPEGAGAAASEEADDEP